MPETNDIDTADELPIEKEATDLAVEIWLLRKTLEEGNSLLFDQNELFGHIYDWLRNEFFAPRRPSEEELEG